MARTEARRMYDKKKSDSRLFRGDLLPPNKCTPKKVEREMKGYSKHKGRQFQDYEVDFEYDDGC